MKKLGSFVLLFVLFAGFVLLTGCAKTKNANSIVGSWAQGSYVYTFNKDNTCSYDVGGNIMECTYELDGENISILYNGNTEPFKTTYSINGDELNIRDSFGNDTIYKKTK